MIRAIILDFDGVILESVSVKTEAFRKLFEFVPDHVDEIIQYHLDNGGMSRFDKIRFIYTHILQQELTQGKFDELSNNFSNLVFEEVIKAPFVAGAHEFLEKYHTRIPLFVVSATPENELIAIVEKKGLTPFFRKIFGSPRKKTECIREIISSNHMSPSSVLFVGDAVNDWDAAKGAYVRFIGRAGSYTSNPFFDCIGIEKIVADLHELDQYITENP